MRLVGNNGALGLAATLLLSVLLGVVLLYAYRSQSPTIQIVPYTAALGALESGRLRSVVIEDGRATLAFIDGTTQQATLPDNGESYARAIADHNHLDAAHPIDLRFSSGSPPGSGLPLVYILPPLILIFPLVYIARSLARPRTPAAYEALSRLADLRDRGVITEDEFQREKRRLLK